MGAIRVRRQMVSKGKHAVEGHYVKNQKKETQKEPPSLLKTQQRPTWLARRLG